MLLSGKTRELGRVIFDLTSNKKRHIDDHKAMGKSISRHKVHVTILIEMVIIGRDLKFYVRWPANENGSLLAGSSFTVVAALSLVLIDNTVQ
jgi:hypothetical protein